MRVLIVDDDDIALEILENALVSKGYEVVKASDGEEAWEIIQEQHIRLVITDGEMPRLDGKALCERIRADDELEYVYVILVTSRDSMQDVVDGLSAGADDFITKPFDMTELSVRLRTGERIVSIETRNLAIFVLAKLAESRDPETGFHLERVRKYCLILARELAKRERYAKVITPDFVRLLATTSSLHDIGKVGIPDAVLLKPGRLNEEEFGIMQQHTVTSSAGRSSRQPSSSIRARVFSKWRGTSRCTITNVSTDRATRPDFAATLSLSRPEYSPSLTSTTLSRRSESTRRSSATSSPRA
jgi:putative two-component system response regulator